ncbi:hypothetical protein HQ560_21085 [bacterium]|nr:hypothetical protein [bacterium]
MAHAYTPGLRVTEHAVIRKERRLPIAGDVLVEQGATVRADDIVARAELPGNVATLNVVNLLGIEAGAIANFMLKKAGDPVARDEVIGETRPWIKWFKSVARSPVDGSIESVSNVTGQVILRMPPRPVEVRAYLDGAVVAVEAHEGVTIETAGAFVQGIFGVGGEVTGEIAVVASGPEAVITPADLDESLKDKVVVAGALVTSDVYERAAEVGAAAIVCGGFHDADLRRLLGYDLGVAITGHEDLRPILIMTEGFGEIAMAAHTFDLLKAHEGHRASANGATQIRAGVLRPELIIPSQPGDGGAASHENVATGGLTPGSPVRIIREPDFGRIGTVKSLPSGSQTIESEARVRVIEVEFPDGATTIVPRANVEAIEQ